MSRLLYSSHSLIRRNLFMLERALVAAGLGLMVYSLMQSIPVYPVHWDVVIVLAVFLLTLWSPIAGYFLAVLASVYPLYSVSLYLAVLFLAVAVIGQHLFIQNLSATLLTLASPLLGGIYIAWIIPIMGGLWWGPVGGAVMGAVAALWGQLFAGMAGLPPDWLTLLGVLPDLHLFARGYSSANSFETLRLLFEPFIPDSTTLLYYLLQVASWAFVGWLVGMLAGKDWAQYHRPRATIVLAAVGAPVLAVLHILPALWLGFSIRPFAWENLVMASLSSALLGALLEAGAYFFEHPMPLPRAQERFVQETQSASPSPLVSPPVNLPPMEKDDQPDDLIMLELD